MIAAKAQEGASTYSAKGMVNVPIIDDRLAIRLVGYYRDVGGFIDAIDIPVDYQKRDFFGPGMDAPAADDATWVANDVNNAEITGGRFSLGALLGRKNVPDRASLLSGYGNRRQAAPSA